MRKLFLLILLLPILALGQGWGNGPWGTPATPWNTGGFTPGNTFPSFWYEVPQNGTGVPYLYQDSGFSSAVSDTGQTVGGWLDKSVNALNVIQTTAASEPVYRFDGTSYALYYDDTDDYLMLASAVTGVDQFEFAFVSKVVDDTELNYVTRSGLNGQIRFEVDGKITFKADNVTSSSLVTGVNTELRHVYQIRYDNPVVTLWVDGVLTDSEDLTGDHPYDYKDITGAPAGRYFHGWFYELIQTDGLLSDIEREQIYQYLERKW